MEWINKIVEYFKEEKELLEVEQYEYFSPKNMDKWRMELSKMDKLKTINFISKEHQTILIMDDYQSMVDLIAKELKRIDCGEGCVIYENYNIVSASSEYAAFIVENALLNDGLRVDIAFLDITLGGVMNNLELDGIDIADILKRANPNCNVKLLTGHTLNKKNPEIFKFFQKFEDVFDRQIDERRTITNGEISNDILEHVISKNDNRVFLLREAILQKKMDNKDEKI